MNEVEILRKLAAAADKEKIPAVDVSRRVIAQLSAQEDDVSESWIWIAALSSAAALLVGVLAYQALDVWTDPLQAVFYNLRWIMT
jgi:hypothetical protein